MIDPSLIVTLKMSDEAQSFFDRQRAKYFPAHINYLDAHCTLFHKLPNNQEIKETFRAGAIRINFVIEVKSLRNIGNGVVYDLECPELLIWHRKLQRNLEPWLIPQDRQKLKPHVTVQNKVTAFKAQQLLKELELTFEPFTFNAVGFSLWLYMNGPWQHVNDFDFQ